MWNCPVFYGGDSGTPPLQTGDTLAHGQSLKTNIFAISLKSLETCVCKCSRNVEACLGMFRFARNKCVYVSTCSSIGERTRGCFMWSQFQSESMVFDLMCSISIMFYVSGWPNDCSHFRPGCLLFDPIPMTCGSPHSIQSLRVRFRNSAHRMRGAPVISQIDCD